MRLRIVFPPSIGPSIGDSRGDAFGDSLGDFGESLGGEVTGLAFRSDLQLALRPLGEPLRRRLLPSPLEPFLGGVHVGPADRARARGGSMQPPGASGGGELLTFRLRAHAGDTSLSHQSEPTSVCSVEVEHDGDLPSSLQVSPAPFGDFQKPHPRKGDSIVDTTIDPALTARDAPLCKRRRRAQRPGGSKHKVRYRTHRGAQRPLLLCCLLLC